MGVSKRGVQHFKVNFISFFLWVSASFTNLSIVLLTGNSSVLIWYNLLVCLQYGQDIVRSEWCFEFNMFRRHSKQISWPQGTKILYCLEALLYSNVQMLQIRSSFSIKVNFYSFPQFDSLNNFCNFRKWSYQLRKWIHLSSDSQESLLTIIGVIWSAASQKEF